MGQKLIKLLDCEDREDNYVDSDNDRDEARSAGSPKSLDKSPNNVPDLNLLPPRSSIIKEPPNTQNNPSSENANRIDLFNQSCMGLLKQDRDPVAHEDTPPKNLELAETNENLRKPDTAISHETPEKVFEMGGTFSEKEDERFPRSENQRRTVALSSNNSVKFCMNHSELGNMLNPASNANNQGSENFPQSNTNNEINKSTKKADFEGTEKKDFNEGGYYLPNQVREEKKKEGFIQENSQIGQENDEDFQRVLAFRKKCSSNPSETQQNEMLFQRVGNGNIKVNELL